MEYIIAALGIIVIILLYTIGNQENKIENLEFLLNLEKELKKREYQQSDKWSSKYSTLLLRSETEKILGKTIKKADEEFRIKREKFEAGRAAYLKTIKPSNNE